MLTDAKHIRVVLWDVYGTLLIAERGDLESLVRRPDALRAAFVQTAHHFRLPVQPAVLHEKFIAGLSRPGEVRIEELWQKLLPGTTIDQAREIAMFFERTANPKSLQPHALETLMEIRRRGLRQGIISNAQFYTRIELAELLGTESIFDPTLVFLSCDLGVAKPDLTAFRMCVERLAADGFAPGQCLMVGDSPANDIAPALAAGMRAVRFAPDGDITDLRQVLERL